MSYYFHFRDGHATTGQYHVLLPDGRTQTVNYNVADDYSGYVADVTYSGVLKPHPAPTVHKPAPYAPPKPIHLPEPAAPYTPPVPYAPPKPIHPPPPPAAQYQQPSKLVHPTPVYPPPTTPAYHHPKPVYKPSPIYKPAPIYKPIPVYNTAVPSLY